VVLGVRAARKQATRDRVLAVARELFQDVGYEETTIRMVAKGAGVSVGSVFTTFSGKAEILSQVMDDRLDTLYAELDRVIPHLRGPTVDRLRSVMAVHYGFEMRRPRMFLAYIGASFAWSPGKVIPVGRNARLQGMLRDILVAGVESQEVRPDADQQTFIDVMLASYFWNYRLASQQGLDAEALIAVMDRQIGLLFDGVAAR